MSARARPANLIACLCIAACSDSHFPDDRDDVQAGPSVNGATSLSGSAAEAGAGGAGGGRNGGSRAAGADAGPAELSCVESARRASAAVADAVDAAQLRCSARSDCVYVSIDTACHASCGALVSVADRAVLDAAIDAQNAGVCAGFEADRCARSIPPCVPPLDFDCVAGRCEWIDGSPRADAGADPDAGPPLDPVWPVPGCIDQEMSWGPLADYTMYSDVHTLAPCRAFSVLRTRPADPSMDVSCANGVELTARVSVDEIDAAAAHADVRAALLAAGVLYGQDPRPSVGTIFRIEVGSRVIDVGHDCAATPGCVAIPPGVASLRSALEALAQQQRAIPNCDALP